MRQVLKIDIDRRIDKWGWMEDYERAVRAVCREFGLKVVDFIWSASSSGKGIHVWIHVEGPELSDEELNKLQFLCGDDRTRVYINRMRIKRGVQYWNKLFSRVLWEKYDRGKCRECKLRKILKELERK